MATTKMVDLCDAVLAAVVAGWPGDAQPLPDRRYITDGAVVWDDCEQLAVSIDRTFSGVEGDPSGDAFTTVPQWAAMRVAHLNLTLLRCVPDIMQEGTSFYAPTVAQVDAAARVLLLDAQALTDVVIGMQLAGCGSIAFEGWVQVGPESGMGGGIASARMMLL